MWSAHRVPSSTAIKDLLGINQLIHLQSEKAELTVKDLSNHPESFVMIHKNIKTFKLY